MFTIKSDAAYNGQFNNFFAALWQAFEKRKNAWQFARFRSAAGHPRSDDNRASWEQPKAAGRPGGGDFYPEPDDSRNYPDDEGGGGYHRMSRPYPMPTGFDFPFPAPGGDGFGPRMAPAAQFRMARAQGNNMGYMAMFAKFAHWFGFRNYSPAWSMQPMARSRDPAFYHRPQS